MNPELLQQNIFRFILIYGLEKKTPIGRKQYFWRSSVNVSIKGESKMPYKSKAQQGFFHAHPEKVGGEKVVKEWDKASKGEKNLPDHVKRHKKKMILGTGKKK